MVPSDAIALTSPQEHVFLDPRGSVEPHEDPRDGGGSDTAAIPWDAANGCLGDDLRGIPVHGG